VIPIRHALATVRPDYAADTIERRAARRIAYRCGACNKFTFTVRDGTIFGASKIPLHKWVYAMYLLVTARKGISSMQLAKEIVITQKSAWFMLQRLREACSTPDNIDKLRGITDIVLAYKAKPKTKAQRKRVRKAKKNAKAG